MGGGWPSGRLRGRLDSQGVNLLPVDLQSTLKEELRKV